VPRKTLLIFTVVYLLTCGLYFGWSLFVTEPGYPLDDSWIHQVFARNIATGHGFSFNPDKLVPGATAPLWTLMMAAFWPISGPIAAGIIVGAFLLWLALIAVYRISIILTNQERLAFLALLLSTVCWPLIWGALSGMEVGLYSALSLWGLYFYLRAGGIGDRKNYLAYALFALSFLSRPECALFLAAAFVADFRIWLKSENRSLIPWLWRLIPVAIILAPYFVFNYSITGSLFTQTYAAKVQGKGLIPAAMNGDIKRVVKSLSFYPYLYLQGFLISLLGLSPILFLSFVAGAAKMATVEDGLRPKRIMFLALVLLYVPLMGTFSPVLTATYHNLRLVDNIIPLIFLISLAGLFWPVQTGPLKYRVHLIVGGAILGLIGGILIFAKSFIVSHSARYLMQDFSKYTAKDFAISVRQVSDNGRNLIVMGIALLLGAYLCLPSLQAALGRLPLKRVLIAMIFVYCAAFLVFRAPYYANDVKNVNDMDKAIGIYLRDLDQGRSVAVGDIGAIGYYSGMRIMDLKGLVSPELSTAMIQNDSLAFEYMLHHDRVDYLAVFPAWFKYIVTRTDMLQPMRYFVVTCNTILADDTTIVFKANWPDSTGRDPRGPR